MAKQQRADITRSQLLDAAQVCFAEKGYDATGVADICRRAGVSKGAFYHHFPSKQALFLELLNHWLAALDARVAILRTQDGDAQDLLPGIAGLIPGVFADAAGQLPMYLEFWRQAARDPIMWEATIAPFHRYREFFTEVIQAGIDKGALRPVDAQIAARAIVAFGVGLLLQGVLEPDGVDWGAVGQEGVHILLEGLVRRT